MQIQVQAPAKQNNIYKWKYTENQIININGICGSGVVLDHPVTSIRSIRQNNRYTSKYKIMHKKKYKYKNI